MSRAHTANSASAGLPDLSGFKQRPGAPIPEVLRSRLKPSTDAIRKITEKEFAESNSYPCWGKKGRANQVNIRMGSGGCPGYSPARPLLGGHSKPAKQPESSAAPRYA